MLDQTLSLSLGYPIRLAPSLAGLGETLAGVLAPRRCVLVTNPVVAPLHLGAATGSLRAAGWDPLVLEIPDGEARKDVVTWTALVDAILAARIDRRTPVLALGGGVTGDLVGFAAASVLRGVPFVQVPTTLLAMVDASVGGKTGVNTPHGKNLLGAFYQPKLVYAAFDTLRTLPAEELRCGLGEVVKHAIIDGEAALAACEADAAALRAGDGVALARQVAASVRTKARVVDADPLEHGLRAILNLGHTLAHAIETVAGYGHIRHGEAVAIGLLGIVRYAERSGLLVDPALPARVERLLHALGLPTRLVGGADATELERAAGFDKKRDRGTVTLALPFAPGDVRLHPVPASELRALVACLDLRAD